jgi:serine/threonine protein phosphatase 1
MHTLIIGDIHGCWQGLRALLEKSGISDSNIVISLGDLVDRGLDSPAVLSHILKGSGEFF